MGSLDFYSHQVFTGIIFSYLFQRTEKRSSGLKECNKVTQLDNGVKLTKSTNKQCLRDLKQWVKSFQTGKEELN
jgi:hypothetical protein